VHGTVLILVLTGEKILFGETRKIFVSFFAQIIKFVDCLFFISRKAALQRKITKASTVLFMVVIDSVGYYSGLLQRSVITRK